MEISFIQMQILVHLHVNKTNFHMKGFALGLTLKQRQKATQKLLIEVDKVSKNHILNEILSPEQNDPTITTNMNSMWDIVSH